MPSDGMQYVHRKLQRSVIEIRRSRTRRACASTRGIGVAPDAVEGGALEGGVLEEMVTGVAFTYSAYGAAVHGCSAASAAVESSWLRGRVRSDSPPAQRPTAAIADQHLPGCVH